MIIDVHAHYHPRPYIEALERAGVVRHAALVSRYPEQRCFNSRCRQHENPRLHRASTCVDSSTLLDAGDRLDRWHIDVARNFGRHVVRPSLPSHSILCSEHLLIRT